jgi:6-phosphofructokinase 1
MGHKVGWIPLYAGIAGGADVILLPEIPYDINKVIETIEHRDGTGSRFSIIVAAEGAISKEEAKLSKKKYRKKVEQRGHSVAYEIAKQIGDKTGREIRIAVPGHTQRGGQPCAADRVFATQVGVEAASGILKDEWGFMVADKNREIVRVPLDIVAGRLKTVDPECQLVKQARLLGIGFGD